MDQKQNVRENELEKVTGGAIKKPNMMDDGDRTYRHIARAGGVSCGGTIKERDGVFCCRRCGETHAAIEDFRQNGGSVSY